MQEHSRQTDPTERTWGGSPQFTAKGCLSLPAQPRDMALPLAECALVVVDMQHQFCSVDGLSHSMGADLAPVERIVPTIAALIGVFRAAGRPVVHTREGFAPDLSDCPPLMLQRIRRNGVLLVGQAGAKGRILVRGDWGCEIIDALAPAPGEMVIDKPGIGTFAHTDAEARLRAGGITHLLVTGVTTDVCVHSFIREANDRGFNCALVSDACASFDQRLHEAALAMTVQQGGLFGWLTTSAAVMTALAT